MILMDKANFMPKFLSSLCLLLSCPPLRFSEVFWQFQTDSAWIPRINVERSLWAWLGWNIQRMIAPTSPTLGHSEDDDRSRPWGRRYSLPEETGLSTVISFCSHLSCQGCKGRNPKPGGGDSSASHMRRVCLMSSCSRVTSDAKWTKMQKRQPDPLPPPHPSSFFPQNWGLKNSYFPKSNLPCTLQGLPWWSSGKESACQCKERRFNSWSGI